MLEFDPEFDRWSAEALDRVSADGRALDLGRHPGFGINFETGRLSFGGDGVVRERFATQFVGTTNGRTWLWAWANPVWDPPVLEAAQQARAHGEAHGVHALVHPKQDAPDLDDLAWRLTAVTAELTGAMGAYRIPAREGAPDILYVVLRSREIVDPA